MTWNIVCDSSCDLRISDLVSDAAHFDIIPLKLLVGGEEYVDDGSLSIPKLLQAMESSKDASSTACPSPDAFAQSFLQADNSICITISGQLSGTYNAAMTARGMVLEAHPEKKICIIDSKAAGTVSALIAFRAKELIEAGGSFEDVARALREYAASLRITFTLCNFSNLIKAGRMKSFVGSVLTNLGIHVIADNTPQGTIHIAGKARGEMKTYKSIVKMMAENKSLDGLPVTISHCENLSGAMKLKQLILQELPVSSVTLYSCKGLCSFYAMEKGILVAY